MKVPPRKYLYPGLFFLFFCVLLTLVLQLPGKKLPPPSPIGFLTPHEPQIDPKECASAYQELFDKPETRIQVSFGYKDTRPARYVGDRYEAMVFAQYLTARCQPGWYACGFERNRNYPDQFRKEWVGRDGKRRKIWLQLTYSSAGPDDNENRLDSHQAWLTRNAIFAFHEGLRNADIVLYNGHSRDGGGPDFAPPRLKKDGHVDYRWYIRETPGKRIMTAGLKGDIRTRILGLYSCSSSEHFLKETRKEKPQLAMITSERLLYYTDALKNMLGTLSGVMGRMCRADLDSLIKAESETGASKITGLFDSQGTD